MKALSKTFFTGLATTVPLFITVYVLYSLASAMESLTARMICVVLPAEFYVPGMGLVAALIVVLVIGVFMRAWIFQRLFAHGEKLFARIPLVKTIYGASRDLMGFISSTRSTEFSQVVLVTLGDTEARMLGFVTRDDMKDMLRGTDAAGYVAVYLPMSYMMGGYTMLLPRSALQPVNMTRSEALRFSITGGLSTKG